MTYRERITHTHTYRVGEREKVRKRKSKREREVSMINYSFGQKVYENFLFHSCNFSVSVKLFLKKHFLKEKD